MTPTQPSSIGRTEAEDVVGAPQLHRILDVALYAVVLTGTLTVGLLALSLVLTRRLVGAKWALFLLGFYLMALGAWKLRPPPPWRSSSHLSIADTRGEGRLQGWVDRFPPLREAALADHERYSDGVKLLVTSFLVLGTSILLEVAGVGP